MKLSDVPALIEELSGRRPSMHTVRRWIRDGYRGVKLQVAGPVQFRHTQRKWVEEFLEQCGRVDAGTQEVADRVSDSVESSSEAKRILKERFGIDS